MISLTRLNSSSSKITIFTKLQSKSMETSSFSVRTKQCLGRRTGVGQTTYKCHYPGASLAGSEEGPQVIFDI